MIKNERAEERKNNFLDATKQRRWVNATWVNRRRRYWELQEWKYKE
jgi:hypothetical protein